MRPLKTLFHIALLSSIAYPQIASAAIGTITDQEYRQLPAYCQQQKNIINGHGGGGTPGGHAMWEARLGPSYNAVHHYCWTMIALSRASRTRDPKQQAEHVASVLSDMNYAITNSEKTFVLLPEMLVKRGDLLSLEKKYPESAKDYLRAIQLKPNYVPAYARLSDLYKRNGQPEEAKKILASGLRASPNSKMLQRKLDQIK